MFYAVFVDSNAGTLDLTPTWASKGLCWQPSLLDPSVESRSGGHALGDALGHGPADPIDVAVRRHLSHGAWIDHAPEWFAHGDSLFEEMIDHAPWHAEDQRRMYDRIVDVPRLTTGPWRENRPTLVDDMAAALSRSYDIDLVSISANLYRDGRDSVAWHGDRVGRHRAVTIVAILSLGSPRTLLVRPNGGGSSVGFTMHSGDLVVMGGTAQVTHEHCVPKRANSGPRISIMFRERFGN